MKTGTVLRLAISLSLLALLASCAPTSNQDSQGYQDTNTISSNIIGGANADLAYAQQNGIVGIYDAQQGALCTGSLIAANLVITAGHCVNTAHPEAMLVFFSPNLDDAIRDDASGVHYVKSLVRQATKVVRHERYGRPSAKGGAQNDVALIRLGTAAPAEFKLATLASSQLTRTLRAGSTVTLSGYGVSAFKADPRTGRPIVEDGAGLLRKVDGIKILAVMTSGEEITLDQSQGRGACHGDSGGPAYYTDAISKQTFVIGVTSRGDNAATCASKAIYTGVMGYEQWIAANSKTILQ